MFAYFLDFLIFILGEHNLGIHLQRVFPALVVQQCFHEH